MSKNNPENLSRCNSETIGTICLGKEDIEARSISWGSLPERTDLRTDEIFIHRLTNLNAIKKAYEAQGWNVTVILQSASHNGPTTAKPIGFPYNFPAHLQSLSRWGNQVILRLHVDLCRFRGKIVSHPHAEPDPKYEPEKHLEMFLARNELRGPTILGIFGLFYHD